MTRTTGRVRVLVVDDSVVARRALTAALQSHAGVEVIAALSSGESALTNLEFLAPDVVTLDVEMPGLSGLDVLREIKRRRPRLPVVMVSAQTVRGAGVTIDALLLGADDYVAKPTGAASAAEALSALGAELAPRVVALHAARSSAEPRSFPRQHRQTTPRRSHASVVVVGASTGGPDALARLCGRLSASTTTPVLLVQHMPPLFTRLLADRLDRSSPLPVREAVDGQLVRSGEVLVAPGDQHMRLRREGAEVRVMLDRSAPVHSCRPAVDVTFHDAAAAYGDGVLACVLTGMGIDGAAGAARVRAAGGQVIVQDRSTSVVWGMPGAVARRGHADQVLPLDDLCAEVARGCADPRAGELTSVRRTQAAGAPA